MSWYEEVGEQDQKASQSSDPKCAITDVTSANITVYGTVKYSKKTFLVHSLQLGDTFQSQQLSSSSYGRHRVKKKLTYRRDSARRWSLRF